MLKMLRPALTRFDDRRVKAAPKVANTIFETPEYKVWRDKVIRRAGGRCEAIDDGRRCYKALPTHRMFADHRIERRDGGALFDPDNGQCLCGSHHTAKTAAARAARR